MVTNSNTTGPGTRIDPKTRIFDALAFKEQWVKKPVLVPIEVDLALETGCLMESDYYRMSRLIFFVIKLLGRAPIHIKSGWMRFSYKSASFIYSVCFALSFVILTICYHKTLLRAWSKLFSSEEELTFENIMFSFLVVMQGPYFVVTIYSWFFEVPKIVKCNNLTAVVEKRISDVFPTSALTPRKRNIITGLFGLYFVGMLVVSNILLRSRFDEAPWFATLMFVFSFIMAHSSCIGWCFNFWFVCCLATKLREHMVMCLEVGEDRACKLKICRKIWMAIWKLSGKFADSFAVTLLFILITNGIIFVIATYGIIASIRIGSIVDILTISPYFLTSYLNVASVFEMAHRATNNLGEKFISTLMAMDKESLDDESVEEVDRFMSMISYSENAKITLKGFITVNRQLIVSFLSYSVTYLIVLIQFQGKNDPQIDNERMSSDHKSEV